MKGGTSSMAWASCLPRWRSNLGCRPFVTRCCTEPHIPVVPDQVISIFQENPPAIFVDGTLGAGGHARRVLREFPQIQRYIGIDQDPAALELAEQRIRADGFGGKLTVVHGNFTNIAQLVKSAAVQPGEVDGIMMDVGVSSMQLDEADRGFSFMRDGDLDMRMDQSRGYSAASLINSWGEDEIGRILREFGEEPRWRRVAAAIVEKRVEGQGIKTTHQLADVVVGALGWGKRNKGGPKPNHPATRTFQGLRIAVNDELNSLANAIPESLEILRPGTGRLAVISFHSLEDRIVKNVFKEHSMRTSGVHLLTKKPLIASADESKSNVRARSAKLRAVRKLRVGEIPQVGRRNKYPRTKSQGDP